MLTSRLLCALVVSMAAMAQGAQFQIGTGSRVDFGDARVNLGCSDFNVLGVASAGASRLSGIDNLAIGATGSLSGANGYISLSANFTRAGAFSAGGSSVAVVDGCGRSTSQISPDATFNNFAAVTTAGKTLQFAGGAITTVTGQLTLQGASGNLLRIRSSTPGATAQLSATTQQTVQYVDVVDNRAIGAAIAYGLPESYQSIAGGNIYRWFQYDQQGGIDPAFLPPGLNVARVPSLSSVATTALTVLLALAGAFKLRRRQGTRK